MDVAARLTSKGQITLPKLVQDALGPNEGDRVVFRVEGSYAVLARTADLLELAGTVPVSPIQQATDWSEIRGPDVAPVRSVASIAERVHRHLLLGTVDIAAVVDVHDRDGAGGVVDAVDDPVGTSPGAEATAQRW